MPDATENPVRSLSSHLMMIISSLITLLSPNEEVSGRGVTRPLGAASLRWDVAVGRAVPVRLCCHFEGVAERTKRKRQRGVYLVHAQSTDFVSTACSLPALFPFLLHRRFVKHFHGSCATGVAYLSGLNSELKSCTVAQGSDSIEKNPCPSSCSLS